MNYSWRSRYCLTPWLRYSINMDYAQWYRWSFCSGTSMIFGLKFFLANTIVFLNFRLKSWPCWEPIKSIIGVNKNYKSNSYEWFWVTDWNKIRKTTVRWEASRALYSSCGMDFFRRRKISFQVFFSRPIKLSSLIFVSFLLFSSHTSGDLISNGS